MADARPHRRPGSGRRLGRRCAVSPARTFTSTAEIDSTISHPGSVRINVKGAFIVDHESPTPITGRASPDHHQTQDIRLPNHHAVVSHIAIDVSQANPPQHIGALLLTACSRSAALSPSWSTSLGRPIQLSLAAG